MIKKSLKAARGQMKPLTPPQVVFIETILSEKGDWRSLALFRIAIDTMLRASDLVQLTVFDVRGSSGSILEDVLIRQQKTQRTVKVPLSKNTVKALEKWLSVRPEVCGEWLFPGRQRNTHISKSQYRREVKRWFQLAHLDLRFYSTHSLRRTKAALIYERTGNIEAVRQLLGHHSVQATSRYLGLEEADALRISRSVEI